MNLTGSILRAQAGNRAPVIAEIKRIIPKLAGEAAMPPDRRFAGGLARLYQEGGAAGISLVTEKEHFGGQPEVDVPAVLDSTSLPLLIKDFNLSRENIDLYADLVSKSGKNNMGRVTLLLTAHWLARGLPSMLDYVHSKGMLALVETRNPEDLYFLDPQNLPELVGINNKDIDDLERGQDSIRLTADMVRIYRRYLGHSLIVSQSAFTRPEDVKRAIESGADAVLVGTAFMLSKDPQNSVESFVHSIGAPE